MPRLTVKVSGSGRLVHTHRDLPEHVTQEQLDAAADAAAAMLTADRTGAASRGKKTRTGPLTESTGEE